MHALQEVAERGDDGLARHIPLLQAICLRGLTDTELAVRQTALLAVSGLLGAGPSFLYL